MATRPAEPTTLGTFFDYPVAAAGTVAPYWLASSPGGGHRVRMTGACKRAFFATIEAVIERAVAPATCGSYPAADTNLKAAQLDSTDVDTLVSLDAWADPSARAALGAKLVRGCPEEEWKRIVRLAAAMWNGSGTDNSCGHVYAWQMGMLNFSTNGWVEADEGVLVFEDAAPVFNLSAFFADADARMSNIPVLRPWGVFGGGSGASPVTDWLIDALESFGPSVTIGSDTEPIFAEGELDGDPAPLVEGHEGNWFGSGSGAIVGQWMSARRSSSAWAVLQAMLANMRFTHLLFPYVHLFAVEQATRTVRRYVTMDETTGDIYVVESSDATVSEYVGDSSSVSAHADQTFAGDIATRQVQFYCADVDAHNLAVSVRPVDGWVTLGQSLVPYLVFGSITHVGDGELKFTRTSTTGIASISAGAMTSEYPAAGMRSYVRSFGDATFVDCESYSGTGVAWTKFSVRPEAGNADLTSPVRAHATWLLSQVPSLPFPTIGSSPGVLSSATSAFWSGWEVYYPQQPNIQVDGQDAYFPTAFRNNTFAGDTDIPITHNSTSGAWESQSGYECIFGLGSMAFPDLDSIHYGPRHYDITPCGQAMVAYMWRFKAMPA